MPSNDKIQEGIYSKHSKQETIDTLREKDPDIWNKALSNEWGHLAQGKKHRVIATDKIQFIHKSEVPHKAAVTYASCVCDKMPLKPEPNRF